MISQSCKGQVWEYLIRCYSCKERRIVGNGDMTWSSHQQIAFHRQSLADKVAHPHENAGLSTVLAEGRELHFRQIA